MTERLLKGEKAAYFPIHRAGRHTEWTHAEKLANLRSLPGSVGFKVMFFPVKVTRATGAWIRAVAIEDEWLSAHSVSPVDLSLPIMNRSFEPEESFISTTHHDQSSRSKAKRLRMLASDVVHAGAIDDVGLPPRQTMLTLHHFGRPQRQSADSDELPLEMFC
jgi:hypothetical protein